MSDLSITINNIVFANPVFTAPGPNVRSAELMTDAVNGGAGGIVSKTISIKPAKDRRPTITRTSCNGIMNCETWSEIPAEIYIEHLKKIKKLNIPLIVSIGYTSEEVSYLGSLVENEVSPDAYEFSTHYVGKSLIPMVEIAKSLRQAVSKPIFMKISPAFPDIKSLVKAVSPIVDGFVAINSFGPVLDFDVETGMSSLSSNYGQGWISGPPILPLGLRIVREISSVQDKPVIGVGGVSSGVDAIKYFMVGASAVGICSAAIRNGNSIYGRIAFEIEQWLETHNYSSIDEIKGIYVKNLNKRIIFNEVPVISVDQNECIGCSTCVSKCIQAALYVKTDKKKADVYRDRCIGCGYCISFCPQKALSLIKR